jgi:DNA-binding GntR family transcriptional regulator
MNDLFDADDYIYIQLANLLRSQIENGYLQGKIPGIRHLAQQYSVNFKTANKAVSLLVQEGHLYRLRGKGVARALMSPIFLWAKMRTPWSASW